MTVYNNYDWLPWKFIVISAGYFASRENQEKFMKWFANEKNLRTEEDWYQISIRVAMVTNGFFIFIFFSRIYKKLVVLAYLNTIATIQVY